jgi:hypothetical protein
MTDWIIHIEQQAAPTRTSTVIFGRRTRRANETFKSTGVFAWPRTRGQFRISGELQPLNFCRTLPWRRERICQAGSMAGLNITKRCSSQCVASPDRVGQAFYDRACSLKPEGIVSKGVDTLRPWQSRPVAQGQTPEPRGVRGGLDRSRRLPGPGSERCCSLTTTRMAGWSKPAAPVPTSTIRSLNVCGASPRAGDGRYAARSTAAPRASRFGAPLVLSRVHYRDWPNARAVFDKMKAWNSDPARTSDA